jgi:Na+-transporting NADH:ubiquinone oxidoreductase subunit NqrB
VNRDRSLAAPPADPRPFQITALGALLAAGAWLRDFTIRPEQGLLAFAAALATQRIGERLRHRPHSSLQSAAITALGLSLLMRADSAWAHPLAAVVAIGAKFALRVRGKHLFNPANLGVTFALLALPGTWVSPGQWGGDWALAGWLVALGGVVVGRARSADVSLAFLGAYLGALALRVLWLGQDWAVWVHQLENGTLLLFAFFMISDPRTIPNHRCGRIAHAVLVAAGAVLLQFGLYRTNALLWALLLGAPAVPVWDTLWPAPKFQWNARGGSHARDTEASLLHLDDRLARRAGVARGAA